MLYYKSAGFYKVPRFIPSENRLVKEPKQTLMLSVIGLVRLTEGLYGEDRKSESKAL